MKRTVWIAAALLMISGLSGCGGDKKESSNATVAASSPAATAEPVAPAPEVVVEANDPAEAVTKFLDALRTGDDKTAAGLLTTKARDETAKHDMVVEPPGAPNATYTVGRVEHPDGNTSAAYVSCVWSETYSGGEEESYEVVWVLRREAAGWRIAGMATQLTANEDPVFLDFEDLAAMEDTVREAEGAARERSTAQAQNPGETVVR